MLFYAKLSKSFRAEAMRTTIDLINLSPSALLDVDVPERVWTGKNVSYKHLRVFGFRATSVNSSKLNHDTPAIESFSFYIWKHDFKNRELSDLPN